MWCHLKADDKLEVKEDSMGGSDPLFCKNLYLKKGRKYITYLYIKRICIFQDFSKKNLVLFPQSSSPNHPWIDFPQINRGWWQTPRPEMASAKSETSRPSLGCQLTSWGWELIPHYLQGFWDTSKFGGWLARGVLNLSKKHWKSTGCYWL